MLNSSKNLRRIVFEGGLGSQILPYLEMSWFKENFQSFVVDTSYFDKNEKISRRSGADHWSYRLDRYNISLDSLAREGVKESQGFNVSNQRNFDLWTSSFWKFCKAKGESLLPIDAFALSSFKKNIGLQPGENYSCIHVRRGDYMRVASKLVSDEEWMATLTKLLPDFSGALVICSDSKFESHVKSRISKLCEPYNLNVMWLEGGNFDECDLHDFMRTSNNLITSNSTFSFSAALLGVKKNRSYVPLQFYGDQELEIINRGFRASGSFLLMD